MTFIKRSKTKGKFHFLWFTLIYTPRQKRTIKGWKKKWTHDEKVLLVFLVFFLLKIKGKINADQFVKNIKKNKNWLLPFSKDKENWKTIGIFLTKDHVECAFKFNSLVVSKIQMEAWKPEEDQLLLEIVRFFLKEKPKMKSLFEIFRNKMSGNSPLYFKRAFVFMTTGSLFNSFFF